MKQSVGPTFTSSELEGMCKELRPVPVRELLRRTNLAWKAAGMPTRRGATAMPPSMVLSMLQMSAEMVRLFTDDEKTKVEKHADIGAMIHRHFG